MNIDGKTVQSSHAILTENSDGQYGMGQVFLNFTDGSHIRIFTAAGATILRVQQYPEAQS
jgi:hypothetical protein